MVTPPFPDRKDSGSDLHTTFFQYRCRSTGCTTVEHALQTRVKITRAAVACESSRSAFVMIGQLSSESFAALQRLANWQLSLWAWLEWGDFSAFSSLPLPDLLDYSVLLGSIALPSLCINAYEAYLAGT